MLKRDKRVGPDGGQLSFIKRAGHSVAKGTKALAKRLSPPDDISHWRNLSVLLTVTLTVCVYNWIIVINGKLGALSEFAAFSIGCLVMLLALWVSIPAGAALKRYCKRQTLSKLIWVFTVLCIFSLIQVVFLPGIITKAKSTELIKAGGSMISAVQLAITSWLVKLPWDRATEAVISSNDNEVGRQWDDPVV